MPLPKDLPQDAKNLWESIFEKSKTNDCDEECAAKKAWSGIKRAWEKNQEGKWVKKKSQPLKNFGMTIKSFGERDGELYWRADCSDIDPDLSGDSMTLGLFKSFVSKIEKNELAPEPFQSEFWKGGMPYLSISHYNDQNGDAVPGDPTAVFVDGKYLKSKGTFRKTPLGLATFNSLQEDKELNRPVDERVRISIGFIDLEHEHKSDGFLFERKSLDDWCPACLREIILGDGEGRKFLDGQLVHLAMTRVPMNERTLMELEEKSMTTKQEDAASIVGDELAAQIDEVEQKSVEKAAFVTKSDLEQFTEVLKSLTDRMDALEEKREKKEDYVEDEEDEEKKEKKEEKSLAQEIAEVFKAINDETNTVLLSKLDLLTASINELQKTPDPTGVPEKRAVTHVQKAQVGTPGKPLSISEFIQRQRQVYGG